MPLFGDSEHRDFNLVLDGLLNGDQTKHSCSTGIEWVGSCGDLADFETIPGTKIAENSVAGLAYCAVTTSSRTAR